MCKKIANPIFIDKTNIYVSECLSTNDFLTHYIKKNPQEEGLVVISDFQTKGKGQRKNKWHSERGKNLLFSFHIKPNLCIKDQFKLHVITSLSIKKTLDKIGIKNVKIKWPNDIYILDKKISGILIESQVFNKKITQSVIGIGLNVNQLFFDNLNATSILKELNINSDLRKILKCFFSFFKKEYLVINENFKNIKTKYVKNLYGYNNILKFQKSDKYFFGKIIDVNPNGSIVLLVNDKREIYDFGSISFT